jgi:hypothetical protein
MPYANKNKRRIADQKRYDRNRNSILASMRTRYAEKKKVPGYVEALTDKTFQRTLKKHGLTLTEYNKLLERQINKCAFCGAIRGSTRAQRLAIDHCHKTNRVRGLLCFNCNTKLGWFEKYESLILTYLKGD